MYCPVCDGPAAWEEGKVYLASPPSNRKREEEEEEGLSCIIQEASQRWAGLCTHWGKNIHQTAVNEPKQNIA